MGYESINYKKEHSNTVCSSQEFQGLCIPHVQAWERLGNEHLYTSWKRLYPRGIQACTQLSSVHFPNVPRLVHGECASLETLGNYRLYCCGSFCSSRIYDYSGTSHNGPSEKRTLTLQRTRAVSRIENTIAVIHKQPSRSGRFPIPDSGQNLCAERRSTIHFYL